MGALPTSPAWGIIDLIFSSLRRELIDFCRYLRGFNAPVASHVFFSFDLSRTVVVNVWALSEPFSPSC